MNSPNIRAFCSAFQWPEPWPNQIELHIVSILANLVHFNKENEHFKATPSLKVLSIIP